MARWASSPGQPQAGVRTQLWLWAAALIACLLSYPAVAAVRAAPWTGAVVSAALAATLVGTGGLSYQLRRPRLHWLGAGMWAIGLGVVAMAIALVLDQAPLGLAGVLGGGAAAGAALAWTRRRAQACGTSRQAASPGGIGGGAICGPRSALCSSSAI